jgi:hypothetical protein
MDERFQATGSGLGARAHARGAAGAAPALSRHADMSEQTRCAAQRRSGDRCRSVAANGSEFCAPHDERAADGELPTTETAGVTSLAPIVANGGTITEH